MQLISKTTLVALMRHKDFTIRGLERASGVNRSTIGHLLTGRRDTCLSANAKAISRALGVPVDALFHAQVSTVVPAARRPKVRAA